MRRIYAAKKLVVIDYNSFAHFLEVCGKRLNEFQFHSDIYRQTLVSGVYALPYIKSNVRCFFKKHIGKKRRAVARGVIFGRKVAVA